MAEELDDNIPAAADAPTPRIVPVNIEEQMKSAYIDYSMSVIVARALPDVRDGLKPVHRRVLYGMYELGTASNKPYKKSARIVGEVLGKYHPHGDSSVYDAMVRMAQPWSMRVPLVDGQGNFGSVDGDSPAAMRYTEARLTKVAEELLGDLEKETVDFRNNFDDSLEEPTVLPAKIPNLLVNGASGIAVGMATNMAPHNLGEAVDAVIAYLDNREITVEELMAYIPAPDFPTGGIIYGVAGIRQAYATGRGRVVIRSKAEIEIEKDRERIIVTEIPYQVNKSDLIARTADLVNDKKIEGISDLRDESDRNGMRIVYEMKRGVSAQVVLNNLYKHTALQSSFSINNIALVQGRPMTLGLKDMLVYFVEHRHEVIVRRTKYDLAEAEKRAHILEGLLKALDVIDEVIRIIRGSQTAEQAREGLIAEIGLSEIQARAVLDMRLQRLTGLEREKLQAEFDEEMKKILYYKQILGDEGLRYQIIREESLEMKAKYANPRRTEITHSTADMAMEDFFDDDHMVITISHMNYIKRTTLTEFKVQGRGGKGSKGGTTRDEDFIEHIFTGTNHNYLLLFTQSGKCYWIRIFEIPEGARATRGRAIQNLLQIPGDDKIMAFIVVKDLKDLDYLQNHFIMFATERGKVKKTSLASYARPRAAGVRAIVIEEGDALLEAKLMPAVCDILLGTRMGQVVRFGSTQVRAQGRVAAGVRGVRLQGPEDEVVGMAIVANPDEETILVLSENGYGKRSLLRIKNKETGEIEESYRIVKRGGKGVRTIRVTEKTGKLIGIKNVTDRDDILIINRSGLTIRTTAESIKVAGRATSGVRIIRLNEGDEIASLAKIVDAALIEEERVELDESLLVKEGDADAEVLEALPEEINEVDEVEEADDSDEPEEGDDETEASDNEN
jgi:DNA gyrase subunit A